MARRKPSLIAPRRIAFSWYGGKFSHLSWLLPLLPKCHHYCEPFGGSAAVLLNREPSPVETYNDLDGQVVNFFRVLREKRDRLILALSLTPYSREEFVRVVTSDHNDYSSVEQARRFYVCARQVRTGLAQTATPASWSQSKRSRCGLAEQVSRWLGGIEQLPDIAERLLRVQLENRPALEVIRLYDDKKTLFYCDPPYPHESRTGDSSYLHEMTDQEHKLLAEALKKCQGRVALSGYACPLLLKLYQNWRMVKSKIKPCPSGSTPRQEALWCNF